MNAGKSFIFSRNMPNWGCATDKDVASSKAPAKSVSEGLSMLQTGNAGSKDPAVGSK